MNAIIKLQNAGVNVRDIVWIAADAKNDDDYGGFLCQVCSLFANNTKNPRPCLEVASGANSPKFEPKLLYFHLHRRLHFEALKSKYGESAANKFYHAIMPFPRHPNNYKTKSNNNNSIEKSTKSVSNKIDILPVAKHASSICANSNDNNKFEFVFATKSKKRSNGCILARSCPDCLIVTEDEQIMISLRIVHDNVVRGNALSQSSEWFDTLADCGGPRVTGHTSDSSLMGFLDCLANARKQIDFKIVERCINFAVSYDSQTKHSIPWFGVLAKVRDENNQLMIMFLNGKILLKKNKSNFGSINNNNNDNSNDIPSQQYYLHDLNTLEDAMRLKQIIMHFIKETKVHMYKKMNGSCSDGASAAMGAGNKVCF